MRRQINIAGIVYNHCIALYRRYYRFYHKPLKKYQLQKHLVKLKHQKKYSYWNEIPSHAIQDITDRIFRAYALFFTNLKRKVKTSPPKFKKVKKYKSFSYNMPEKNLVCDVQDEPAEARTGESIGFGLKRFLTASDGHDIESPDFFTLNAKRIKIKSRNLSPKKESSHNRERARLELARAYRKMENQRKDFHFKLARKLCEQYAVICLEDLNIRGMARLWGRKIHSLGFYSFVQILKYEAQKLGTRIVFIDRFYPSSQLCSVCSYKNEAVKDLKVRDWECPSCHMQRDRDRNAAKNIVRTEQSGSVVDAKIPCLYAWGVCQ